MTDLFEDYKKYIGQTESPMLFMRWGYLSMLGALLAKKVYLPFGHSEIYPNQYIMLMGSPGTRKALAIKAPKALLKEIGYSRVAADRTSEERFLIDMGKVSSDPIGNLENLTLSEVSDTYVMAEEFNAFIGANNISFLTMLTDLWDNKSVYEHPKIHGKSVTVTQPLVNIIGANTPENFAIAIPPEALGNGFMSRLLLVYSEGTGVQITWPEPPNLEAKAAILTRLMEIQDLRGPMSCTDEAKIALDRIYKEYKDLDDYRFRHYSNRRFTHLLKLCIILAASEASMTITHAIAIKANTILAITEARMPRALGEFGRAKNSSVANNIIEFLHHVEKPATTNEIWRIVSKDLNDVMELAKILKKLQDAHQITTKTVGSVTGFLPNTVVTNTWADDLLDYSYVTKEELI